MLSLNSRLQRSQPPTHHLHYVGHRVKAPEPTQSHRLQTTTTSSTMASLLRSSLAFDTTRVVAVVEEALGQRAICVVKLSTWHLNASSVNFLVSTMMEVYGSRSCSSNTETRQTPSYTVHLAGTQILAPQTTSLMI
jgi:hypothetical protein